MHTVGNYVEMDLSQQKNWNNRKSSVSKMKHKAARGSCCRTAKQLATVYISKCQAGVKADTPLDVLLILLRHSWVCPCPRAMSQN